VKIEILPRIGRGLEVLLREKWNPWKKQSFLFSFYVSVSFTNKKIVCACSILHVVHNTYLWIRNRQLFGQHGCSTLLFRR
jgi:hypothetical protein